MRITKLNIWAGFNGNNCVITMNELVHSSRPWSLHGKWRFRHFPLTNLLKLYVLIYSSLIIFPVNKCIDWVNGHCVCVFGFGVCIWLKFDRQIKQRASKVNSIVVSRSLMSFTRWLSFVQPGKKKTTSNGNWCAQWK